MFNYIRICTWVYLQFYDNLCNQGNFVIRTFIRVLILGNTYNYTNGYMFYTRVYIHLYEWEL